MNAYLGIDVGTGSARAAVFDARGTILGHATQDIALFQGQDGFVEQPSTQIWAAVCGAARAAVTAAGVVRIAGIGVDATCSMIVEGRQLSEEGSSARDVIVWMDHRATAEAEEINAGAYEVMNYVGGRIPPEMQVPKLLWLSRTDQQILRRRHVSWIWPIGLLLNSRGRWRGLPAP